MWGFESLLPCQIFGGRNDGGKREADWMMATMAQTAKLKPGESNGSSLNLPGPIQRISEYPGRIRQFIHEVRVELKQVNWPTKPEVTSTTLVVIITVAFFGVYFFFVDRGVSWFIQSLLKFFK
jgi:preprotein translocase subunit SecE